MVRPLSQHPDADQLRAFSSGSLTENAAVEAISQHLDECPECLGTLEGVPGDTLESLVLRAQRSLASSPTSSLADPQSATLSHRAEEAAGDPVDDLSFLTPPQAPDEVGRLGQYRILKVLGEGGMGLVFQAEDIHLERCVALKVMRPHIARRADARERFLREAKLAAAIEHENVVTIHQVGEINGVPFLAMPWLKGMSLEERLKNTGKLSIPQVLRLGRQIALGLAAAHERGLIHRDIKPGNLWIEPEQGGRIKILDFGLARTVDREEIHLTQSGVILGTPAYMAPEQAQAQKVGPACDLFSLGVVLYRLATGQLPFQGENTTSLLLSLVMHEPKPPHTVNPEVPSALSELMMQLLVKDPAQRLTSATEVAERLQHLERDCCPTDTISEALPAVGTSATSAPKKRRPGWLIAAAVGPLLLLGAALAAYQIGFATPQGVLLVEIKDKEIEARFKNGKLQLLGPDGKIQYTLQPSENNKRLPAGPYKIQVTGADGLTVDVPEFVMRNGDRITVHVQLQKPTVAIGPGQNDRSVVERVLSWGGSVTLDVDGKQVEVKAVHELPAGVWKVRGINLRENKQVTDAELKELARLKQLQALTLYPGKVTDAGVKDLAGLRELRELTLHGSRVTDAWLKELAGLTELESLELNHTRVTDAGLKGLVGLKKLQSLIFYSGKVTDAGLKEVAGLTQLQTLQLGNTQVTDVGLKELAGLKRLEKLDLAGTQVTDAGLKELAGLKGLLRVNLNYTQVTDAGLKELAGLKPLESLELNHTRVSDKGLKELVGLKQLVTLGLGNTQVTDAGLKELTGLKQLAYLPLSNTPVTDAGLKELAGLEQLRSLRLDGTQVKDAGLKELAGLKRLEMLYLDNTPVTDGGLEELAGLNQLKYLGLKGTRVSAEGVAELQKTKPQLRVGR